ncbi:sulfatase family protein [Peristeroidobacter soli]|uniref:sulfatase family protein n=1 Tax=Peristeroidobacter soli TaxID=2497877 RepID=UPI00101B9B00|nr:sulfatase [Peristeroidobacter soli]
MKRRTLLASAAGAVLGSTLLSTRRVRAASAEKRNVLLLIADDQGLDAGCYGTGIATPRIDALARRGTRFTQAFAAVSSCSPSRSVIYTGLYSHSNGMYGLAHDVHNQSLLDGVDTLPLMMKRAGYATALVGKKHVRPDSAFVYDAELAPERSGIRDVAFMADEALRFIRGVDRPFFVTVAYSDPHRAPVNYGNDRAWPRVEPVHYDPARVPLPSHLPDVPEVRRDLAEYYQSVSRLDTGVGLLLDGLRDAGHADDTLIIYLSDNGRPFPGAKTNLYDPGLHLPLIVHAPGAAGQAVNDAMVSFIDIVPTILDWSRAPAPERALPGRSLLPLLGKSGASGWDRIFASHDFHEINQYYPMRSVRTRTHNYIVNLAHPLDYPIAGDVEGSPSWKAISARPDIRLGRRTQAAYLKRPAEELYDLKNDADELVNLAGEPRAAAVLTELRKQLFEFRRDTADPWLAGQTSPYSQRSPH